MIKNSRFGKIFALDCQKILLLVTVLSLSACATDGQKVVSAEQPTSTATVAPANPATSIALSTPLPVSTSTRLVSTPRPPSRTAIPNTFLWGAELVETLRGGGYVIYIHSEDRDQLRASTDNEDLENCDEPSNLNEKGQFDARNIGASLLALGIPVGQVLHSESCSSLEIAMLAFGQGKNWAKQSEGSIDLRGERIAALREMLSTPPQPGTNNVFIGHGLDIEDVTNLTLEAGEAAAFKPLGKTGYAFVARVLPREWAQLEQTTSDLVPVETCIDGVIQLELSDSDSEEGQANGQFEICRPDQSPTASPDLLLPDLITMPPNDLRILVNQTEDQKLLRFTNSIMNIGPGKMELWGETNPETGKVTVTQHIYYDEEEEDVTERVVVGEFFFHDEHNHWHLGDFARYEIWSLFPDGEFDSVVALSNKVSYCLRDDARSDIPSADSRQNYISCEIEKQGISVGWIDIYRYHLPGQTIDITSLPDGVYALRSIVDPENSLRDRNSGNNAAILYMAIEGRRVSIVESQDSLDELLEGQEE